MIGWDDIGYNFLVGEDGNIYEGRGWTQTGAHCIGYNSKSIGRFYSIVMFHIISF
jgi:N-acetylmuramoyl-L-alanine amidase